MAPTTGRSKSNLLSDALRLCRTGLVAVVFFSFAINLLLLTAPLYMLWCSTGC